LDGLTIVCDYASGGRQQPGRCRLPGRLRARRKTRDPWTTAQRRCRARYGLVVEYSRN